MISTRDYDRIERAILYLEEHFREQPRLPDVARAVHLSEFHFQRLFRRWVGLSPKRFLQFLTVGHAKDLLERSSTVLDATIECGLSSPGRLHDLFVTLEAVTPGEFKRRGEDISIEYGFHPSPFGECCVAVTARGICGLFFLTRTRREEAVVELGRSWDRSVLREDPEAVRPFVERIFPSATAGERTASPSSPSGGAPPIPLHVRGTNFQIKVWEALLRIPEGFALSYQDLARRVGRPDATRAVAGAVAANPIAWIVPCHRVLRKSGALGGYRWGTPRKRAMLAWESARRSRLDPASARNTGRDPR